MKILLIPILILAPFLWFTLLWLIPEMINDRKWNEYDKAWYEWYNNGRKGEMPQAKDYGYKDHV